MFGIGLSKTQQLACKLQITMIGITRAEQEELYRLATSKRQSALDEGRALTTKYLERGAIFMFDARGNRVWYEEEAD